jgi:membrane protease YdiL (CAAX protease family)
VVTWLAVLVLVVAAGGLGWLMYAPPRLGDVETAEQALPQIVGRTMDLRAALMRASPWERRVYDLVAGDVQRDLQEAIGWYEELARESPDSAVRAQLLILEGEAGRLRRLRAQTEEWPSHDWLRQLIRRAYLEPAETADDDAEFRPEQVGEILDGWFYDRLAIRWGQHTGATALVATARTDLAERAAPLLWRARGLAAIEVLTVLLGGGALVVGATRIRRARTAVRVAGAPLPPPWPGRTGVVVLVRGAAIGAVGTFTLGVALWSLEQRYPIARIFGWPVYVLMFLPTLLLARRHLLRPWGLDLAAAFGLRPEPGGIRRLLLATFMLIGIGTLADFAISLIAENLRLSTHWTEWFSEDLVWGGPAALVTALVEVLVLAPVLEELVFRGLLYGTLRRCLGPLSAAAVSAGLFAVGHGYGMSGLASVFTAGVIYAWAYEQTGSLLPGMAAHAASNLLATLTVAGLLRA